MSKLLSLLVVLIILNIPLSAAQRQETARDGACASVFDLMENNTVPYFSESATTGGGTLGQPGEAQSAVMPETVYADFWSFQVDETTDFSINFAGTDALEFNLFNGLRAIWSYQPLMSARTSLEPGVYTLVLRRLNWADSKSIEYQIFAEGSFSPAPQAGSIKRMGNPNNATPTVIADGIEKLEINDQIIYGHPGSILDAWENPLGQTTAMNLSPNESSFYINTWAPRIGFLGGDLVVVDDDSTPRYLYVERFDSTKNYRGSSGNLSTIHDQDLTNQDLVEMEIGNWDLLQGVWVFEDCLGVALKSGQKFAGEIDPNHRSFSLSGTRNDFRVQIERGDGQTYDFTFDWDAIHESEGKVWMSSGVVHIEPMVADKVLELQATNFVLQAMPATISGTRPITVQIDNDLENTQDLEIDWRNLDRVGLFESYFELEFDDGVRTGITVRPTNNLAPESQFTRFRAWDEVVHIQYADGAERLMLPESEGFIELITPGGAPSFDPAAVPGETGYLPRGLNNLGGECYSVNTALPEANCPPNGHPNPSNGNLWYAVTDLVAYGGTFDLALTRSYNSRAADQDGPFGPGWATDFFVDYPVRFEGGETNARPVDLRSVDGEDEAVHYAPSYVMRLDLTWAPHGLVIFRTASGSRHAFTLEDAGWRSYTMPGWNLTAPGESPYWMLVQAKGDQAYDFDRAGRLRRYGSPSTDRWIEIDYPWSNPFDNPNKLVVSDAGGRRKLEIFFNEDYHIGQAVLHDGSWQEGTPCTTDANCFETRYVYDETGNLEDVIYYDGQKASYAYDGRGHLVWHNDPRAPISPNMYYDYTDDYGIEAAYILEYDTTREQVRIERDELGAQVWRELSYQPDHVTTVVDEYNVTYTYAYDVKTTESDWRAGANNFTLKSSHNSLTGVSESYTWTNGQIEILSQLVDDFIKPLGDMHIYYDEVGGITRINLPQGHSLYSMDMLRRQPSGSGFDWQFDDGSHLVLGYGEGDNLVTMQSRAGASYEYIHLTDGVNVLRSDDEMTWKYRLDDFGLVESVEQLRPSSEMGGTGHTILYERDAFGRLARIRDSVLGTYTMAYAVLPCDAAPCSYRDARMLISMTDPTGTVTRRYFDGLGRMIEECLGCDDETGKFLRRTTYAYDEPIGHLVGVSRLLADDEAEDALPTALTTSYIYERVPELDGDAEEPEGTAIMGEAITEVEPDGRRRTYVYDALGRIRSVEDEWGRIRRYEYGFDDGGFAAGRNDINTTITEYNFYRGELHEMYRYNYDQKGQIRKIEHLPAGEETWRTVGNFLYSSVTTTALESFNYEKGGLDRNDAAEIRWGNPTGTFLTSVNLKVTTGDPKFEYVSTVQPAYDYLGRVTQTDHPIVYCAQPDGGLRVLHLVPDAVTEVPCLDYENGQTDFVQQAIDYDVHGRVIRRADSTTTYDITYTPETDPPLWRVEVNAGSTSWKMRFDPTGDMVYWLDEIGTEHFYDYDTLGRLVEVTVPDEPEASFTFAYNEANMLTEMYDGLGRGTVYEYDGTTGLLVAQQDAATQAVTTYTYGDYGLLSSVTSPSGYTTTYLYEDPKDPSRLTDVLTSNGQHNYVWGANDSAGNTTMLSGQLRYTNPRGEVTDYFFDKAGLLRKVVDAMSRTYTLGYDNWGNLTSWNPPGQQFDLAPAGQITRVSAGNTWVWSFDGDPLGLLRAVVGPDQQTLALDYDSFGQLKTVTVGEDELAWTLDRSEDRTLSISTPSTPTLDSTLSFDQLYRLVGDGDVSYDYNMTEDGEMELTFEEAGNRRRFTFFAGESGEPAKITLDAPGQRITYTYNDEHLLAHITREVCIGPQAEETLDTCVVQADDAYLENLFECLNEEGMNEAGWEKCEENPNRVPPLLWTTTISFFYDANDRPIRIVDQANNVETFAYDETGNLTNYQNRRGETFTYFYDAINRLDSLMGPSGVRLLFAYSALDRVTGICRTRETNIDFETCTADGGTLATFAYDALGRMTFQNGISYGYDLGLLSWWDKEVTNQESEARDVLLGYQATGLLRTLNISGQTYTFEYAYDIDGMPYLTSVTGSGGMVFGYGAGRVSDIQSGEYVQRYTYDAGEGWSYSVDGGLNLMLDEQGFLKTVLGEFDAPLTLTYKIDFDNAEAPFSIAFDDRVEKREIYLDEYDDVRTIDYFQYSDSREKFEPYLTVDYTQLTAQSVGYTIGANEDYLMFGADGGYQIIIGQDLAERPLSMRVIDKVDDSLLYSATYTYNLFGRRESELRHYNDGTRFQSTFLYGQNNDGTERVERRIELTFPGKAKPLVYTYIYEYDEFGNLIRIIPSDGTESPQACATYEYDGANRLIGAAFPYRTRDDAQRYSYDAFNRLVSAGSRRYVYQGMSQVPLLMEEDGVVFYAQLAGSPILFAQDEQGLQWLTHDGRVFTFNPQADTDRLYLFDPLGNNLVESLAGQDNLIACDLIRSNLPVSAAQPAFDNMIWDAKANLYFIDGRAYDPALGRFLQRNPLGPDALGGGIYQYPAYSTDLPIRERAPAFLQGLQVLADAADAVHLSEALASEAIAARYRPAPISFTPNALMVGLQHTRAPLWNDLEKYIMMPQWLKRGYNLPDASIDPNTGAVTLPSMRDPHQPTPVTSAALPTLHTQPWQPSNIGNPSEYLSMLIDAGHMPMQRVRWYEPEQWRPAPAGWEQTLPPSELERRLEMTPSVIRQWLPKWLDAPSEASTTLALTQMLAALPQQSMHDWLQTALSAALPAPPSLPRPDAASWRDEWFSTDLVNLENSLRSLWPVPTVDTPAYQLGVNPDWLYIR